MSAPVLLLLRFVAVVVALLVGSAIGGLFLWVASKIGGTRPVSFLRCWMAYLAATLAAGVAAAIVTAIVTGVVTQGLAGTPGDTPAMLALLVVVLLIVLAIEIGVVVSILDGWYLRALVAFGSALVLLWGGKAAMTVSGAFAFRTAARKAVAQDNLRQLGWAMHNYENVRGNFPPAATSTKDGKPLLSWRVLILPYMDHDDLYRKFKLDEPWDSAHNKALLPLMPEIYRPVNCTTPEPCQTCYQVFVQAEGDVPAGKGRAPFSSGNLRFWRRGPSSAWFSDGAPNTFLIVEGRTPVLWTKPEDIPYFPSAPLPELGGQFKDGFNALFADGVARFISRGADERTIRAMITFNGGEAIVRPF